MLILFKYYVPSLSCKITFTTDETTNMLLVKNKLVKRMVKQLRTLQLL